MPRKNGTGPQGQGARTGRGLGNCNPQTEGSGILGNRGLGGGRGLGQAGQSGLNSGGGFGGGRRGGGRGSGRRN